MREDLSTARVKVLYAKRKEVYIPRMRFLIGLFLVFFSTYNLWIFDFWKKKGSKYQGKYINSNSQIVDNNDKNDKTKEEKINDILKAANIEVRRSNNPEKIVIKLNPTDTVAQIVNNNIGKLYN